MGRMGAEYPAGISGRAPYARRRTQCP